MEQVIQEAEGKGIDRVDAPRQRLEQFFMELVEQARREHIETSGVVHGGATAGFLKAEDARGEQLIDSLARVVPINACIDQKRPKVMTHARATAMGSRAESMPEPD